MYYNKLFGKRLESERKNFPKLSSKRGQEVKSGRGIDFPKLSSKRGQEEMIGFAIIIILVSVILLVFLGFSLNQSPKKVSSYEVEGFLQSALKYTTSCDGYYGNLSIKDVIFECDKKETCLSGGNPCEILNDTLIGMLETSWPYGNNSIYKGYIMNIWKKDSEEVLFSNVGGNVSRSYKWASQELPKIRDTYYVEFKAFY